METLQQYLFSIICTALLCGILSSLTQKGIIKSILSLLCGCILTVSVIRQLGSIQWESIWETTFPYKDQAKEATAIGTEMAYDATAAIIKEKTEAYILEKADSLNAELTVMVTVSTENIPESAFLEGEISPNVRKKLEAILETDLGITKENQIWNG